MSVQYAPRGEKRLNRDYMGLTPLGKVVFTTAALWLVGDTVLNMVERHQLAMGLEARVENVSVDPFERVFSSAYADQGPSYGVVASSYEGQ